MIFKVEDLPAEVKQSMIDKKVWQPASEVKLEQLSLVTLSHYDFTGEVKKGQMVVAATMTQNVLKIFKELFIQKFPVEKINLIDVYNGDDELSMEDNNTSCFNYRKIMGLTSAPARMSMHAYGLAIDINPLQNPYMVINEESGTITVYPKEGSKFLNRSNQRPGMVEPVVNIFKQYGFDIWGGEWNSPIDYHHFQVK